MAANPPRYYSNPRREMLTFIPLDVTKVLEIGCGTGEFAGLLKKERNAEVWGIEIEKEAAEQAATRLDKVLVGDIEHNEFDFPKEYFDCIVFNDVLEHLRDPWSVLRKIQLFLKKKGYVVASIPNVRYIANIRRLLKYKDWKYEDDGILDRTHLRFFTMKSIRELFEYCGYDIVSISGIRGRQFPWKFRLINAIMMGTFDGMRYMQFACVAQST